MVGPALLVAALSAAPAALTAEGEMPLTPILHLPWSDAIPETVATLRPPPGGSFLALPGPTAQLARPALQPAAGAGGLIARALTGEGAALPLAIDAAGALIPLPEPPRALSPRSDGGFWALYADRLARHASDGAVRAELDVTGATLIPSGDGVWVLTTGAARRVDAAGVPGPTAAWSAGLRAAATPGGAVCALTGAAERAITCLSPDGQTSAAPAPAGVEAFEVLIAIDGDAMTTRSESALSAWRGGQRVSSLSLRSVGSSAQGAPWASARADDGLLLQVGAAPARRLLLPEGTPTSARVVAVDGDRALVFARDRAAWFDGEAPGPWSRVDDESYPASVFSHLWALTPDRPVTQGADGRPLIAASGPGGLALFALDWP